MSFQNKTCWVLFTLSLMLVCLSLTQAKDDFDLRTCKQKCRVQRRFDEQQTEACVESCEKYAQEKGRRGSETESMGVNDERSQNPYVFKSEHFETQFRSNEGRVRVLPKFRERSQLFKGIQNYRVVLFEANPQTFILPNHWDADIVLFVAQGRGTVTLVFTDRRESFNIEQGHVMVVPAGVTAYLINRDDNQKLILTKLVIPVSNPAQFQPFFSSASQNAQSFFNGFSREVLEAVFKTSADRLQTIFGSQTDKGVIKKASKEQIRALTHDDNPLWPFGDKSSKDLNPINILNQSPKESNEYGQLYEIDTLKNKVLQELGIALSFANISQGAMHAIYYNSRATKIAVVVNGRGELEMSCPHVQSRDQSGDHDSGRSRRSEEDETPARYQKMSSELRPGTVFIVPPGHPFVTIASQNDNLQIFCFEVNAENNHKFPLAGQKNILKNIEKEAKDLTYGGSADEVDSVLNNRNEDFFFQGPRHQRRQHDYSII